MSIINEIKECGTWDAACAANLTDRVRSLSLSGRITEAQRSYADALLSNLYRASLTSEDVKRNAREDAAHKAASSARRKAAAARRASAPTAELAEVGAQIVFRGETLIVDAVQGSGRSAMYVCGGRRIAARFASVGA